MYFHLNIIHFSFSLALMFSVAISGAEQECSERLNNCTQMVRPYLNDIRYMFPTKLEDVDEMCRMWSQFVDCIRKYVSQCFSEERKLLFHKSVENSVDTVHAICSSEHYQKEYLQNAVCFKRISVDSCGQYYKQLIEHVSNPRAHDDHICCSYGHFQNCVNDPLLRECGRRARSLMDHSMGFLITRCANTHINGMSEGCPSPVAALSPMPTTTTTEEQFDDQNELSESKTREDRSFDVLNTEESSIQSTDTDDWTPRPIVYTLPPEPGSQTSAAISLFSETLFKSFSISLMLFIFTNIY